MSKQDKLVEAALRAYQMNALNKILRFPRTSRL